MTYVIEKGIPIPPSNYHGGKKTPARLVLEALEVSDSVLLPTRKEAASATAATQKANPDRKYSLRRVEGGFRVWRLA